MRAALSVRIAESPRDKTRLAVALDTLLDLAAQHGFEGISVRASAVSVESSPREIAAVRKALDERGLVASMVTGDIALAANDQRATAALRNIGPYLDLAAGLGARLVRVMLHDERDIPLAQRAADEAAERDMVLSQQCHWHSLAETVNEALALVRQVDRDNFRITYEPANLLACGSAFGADAVARLAPCLANVYLQNICLDPASPTKFRSRNRGDVGVRFVPLDHPRGIRVAPILNALRRSGYDGWVTVHQPLLAGETLDHAIAQAVACVAPVLHRPDDQKSP